MFETLRNAWRVKEIRNKILYTLMIVLVFRIGSYLPVPFIDVEALKGVISGSGAFFNYLNVLTGGAMEYGALFAMSITPYINASIIMQLLTVAIPPLERLAQEGQEGQRKIAKYTRFATVILGLIQGTAFWWWLFASNPENSTATSYIMADTTFEKVFSAVVIILCFTAGSALMMWLGERIDENGIGNGISILLFAGIISRLPSGITTLYTYFTQGKWIEVLVVLVILTAVILFIVWMQFAERRIPIQYAKRVVGRKQYGGQNSHMPIKVNMSGVLPIIFASSILMIPQQILTFMNPNTAEAAESTWYRVLTLLDYKSWTYATIYFGLIIAFAYFYTSIQYNPVEMANNLRKNNGAIPGIRPGKPTQTFIKNILSRITLIGAIFLGVIAILPILIGQFVNIDVSLGGTSMLIVVGVAIDTVQSLESQMMMRHYKGFLD
ncbi:MAG: preprotein translocase subunit SecY [Acutalibacteraceae bacterium]|nr:preprotein translocase subunit SecY [Acutalibacteraceae bacterium]